VVALRCRYDPDTLGKNPEGRKVRGVIHWVSARHGVPVEVRLYDRLFSLATPDALKDGRPFTAHINPDSLRTLTHVLAEPSLTAARPGERFQFEREGYFVLDTLSGPEGKPVLNRTVTLRDTWAKLEQQV